MKLEIVNDEIMGGQCAYQYIAHAMETNTLHVLGLATGSTPLTLYKQMVDSHMNFDHVVSVNLDEYLGLAPNDTQSYHYFMQKHLFQYKPFKHSYIPDGLNGNNACQAYEEILEAYPVDIQILGIGRNGHIGFNEPGTAFDTPTHIVDLTPSTIEANQRFFEKKEDVPTQAISMGIGSIMKAKQIILLAYGESKAEAIKAMLEGPVTEEVPASILQRHNNVIVIADTKAAQLLSH